MAEALGSSDILKCSICFEVFKTPKYLPCLHTFCESCLDTYITSLFKNGQTSTGFNCPVCRTFVPGPENTKADEWAKVLPINHLIVTLIEQKGNKSDRLCNACMRENVKEKAESLCVECSDVLCSMCVRYHKKNKASFDHQIINFNELNDNPMGFLPPPKLYCSEHCDKKLEIFCVDHDSPCCLVCMTIHHRKCDKIVTLDEATKDIRDNKVPKLSQDIEDTNATVMNIVHTKEQNIKDLELQHSKIKSDISAIRKEINDHYDGLESNQLKELNKLYDLHMSELKNEEGGFKCHASVLADCQKVLKTCRTQGPGTQIVLEYNRIKSRHQEISTALKSQIDLGVYGQIHMDFEASSNLKEILKSVATLGTFKIRNPQQDKSQLKVDLQKAKPVLKSTFDLPAVSGLGCEFLPTNKIIVTDCHRPCCFICDTTGTFQKELRLPGNAFAVTLIDSKQAVITLEGKQMIQCIDIENVCLGKTVQFDAECYGVCAYKNELFIAFDATVRVFDVNGQEMKRLQLPDSSHHRLISVTKDQVYYTNCKTNCVHCMNMSGTAIFCYKDGRLSNPLGISVDYQGNVYVAGNQSDNVHQISPEGKLIRILLNVKNPYGLQFKCDSNMFILTTNSGKTVNMYELQ